MNVRIPCAIQGRSKCIYRRVSNSLGEQLGKKTECVVVGIGDSKFSDITPHRLHRQKYGSGDCNVITSFSSVFTHKVAFLHLHFSLACVVLLR